VIPTDYPAEAIQNADEGTVSMEVLVSSSGEVSGCTATSGTASTDLKSLACDLVKQRARFEPGQDRQGNPVSSVFKGTVRWDIPDDTAPTVERRLLVLPVPLEVGPDMPIPSEGTLEVVMTIAPDGSTQSCRWLENTGYFDPDLPRNALEQICLQYFVYAPAQEEGAQARTFRLRASVEEIVAE
tara:strand:- start:849 stop:1400 length:552 start_codon:yes stop_codon:yes gene_type:complete